MLREIRTYEVVGDGPPSLFDIAKAFAFVTPEVTIKIVWEIPFCGVYNRIITFEDKQRMTPAEWCDAYKITRNMEENNR